MKYCPQCATPLVEQDLDGESRTLCTVTGCGFVFWDNPVPVVAALVQHEGNIILARNAGWPAGIFSLISGYLERDETPEDGIVREVKEELGLTGSIDQFIGYYPFFKQNQLLLCFSIHATGQIVTNDEIAEVEILTKEALQVKQFDPFTLTSKIVEDWLLQTASTNWRM